MCCFDTSESGVNSYVANAYNLVVLWVLEHLQSSLHLFLVRVLCSGSKSSCFYYGRLCEKFLSEF